MRSSSRPLVILLCLFLISFKVAASSVFIDVAIERAQMHQIAFTGFISQDSRASHQSTDGEQHSHTLFMMSHVTANVSDMSIAIPLHPSETMAFISSNKILCTQNFPDSAFKPPKTTA